MTVNVNVTLTANDGSVGALAGQVVMVKPLPPLLVGAHAVDYVQAQSILGPLSARRVFYPHGLPGTYGQAGVPANNVGFISYKEASTNTVPFVKTCPPGTRIIYHHEPENDYGPDGTLFRQEFEQQYALVKAANPLVRMGMVAMTYQYAGGRNGQSGSYIPDICDFYGADNYQEKPAGKGLAVDPEWLGWMHCVQAKGKPLSLCEYGVGVYPVGTSDPWSLQRTNTLIADHEYLRNLGMVDSILYWYSTGSKGEWRFTDKPSVLAWSAFSH